jgi:hypothetical protein
MWNLHQKVSTKQTSAVRIIKEIEPLAVLLASPATCRYASIFLIYYGILGSRIGGCGIEGVDGFTQIELY